MPEERRRRRGHRRRRGERPKPAPRPGEQQPEEQPEVSEESEAPGILPPRLRFGFRRRRREGARERGPAKERAKERPAAGLPHVEASPLGFWRRGHVRSYRKEAPARHTWSRSWQRIRGMYFPPWVPVAAVIAVVFAILGGLFFVRGATGAPRIARDHWHATYQTYICGERQPNAPEWHAGVHTHADGIIHIHPFVPSEEGSGARLAKWFEYGGGKLTQSELRMPGSRDEYKNGDECPDGSEGVVQVEANDQPLEDWTRYIPQDGDRIRIVFGPAGVLPSPAVTPGEGTPVAEQPLTPTPELSPTAASTSEPVAQTVDVVMGEVMGNSFFQPNQIEVSAGQRFRINLTNNGTFVHNLRISGPNGEYDDGPRAVDDLVSSTDIEGGETGELVGQIDVPGTYPFRCDFHPTVQTGTITVR